MCDNSQYSADVERISSVQFSLLGPDEIRRRSVVEITRKELYDGGGIPCPGGLFDLKMGVLDSRVHCSTDDLDKQQSPGYFGHIELAMPVFYIQFMKWIKDVLQMTCFRCGSLLLSRDLRSSEIRNIMSIKSGITRYSRMVKLIKDDPAKVNNVHICGACNARQPNKFTYVKDDLQIIAEWTRGGKTNDSEDNSHPRVLMTPDYVQMLFKRISDEDSYLIGFNPKYSRPEWMICSVLPVCPPCVRPSVKQDGSQRQEDDLTHKFIDIIKCNMMLKQKLQGLTTSADGNLNSKMIESWRYILQYHVATLIDNECGVNPAQQRTGRPLKAIRQRLKSKEGRIRGNLMGKRVDFSARTVITPDPILKLDELGVPMEMCTNLTVPERVNIFNIESLKLAVMNGPEKHPGAKMIEKISGRKISLKYFKDKRLLGERACEIQIGDIVHRHLIEGDRVLFNRQPSLHKMSMMCHRVKPVTEGKTFRLNVDITAPYNADFDGDEMNMHVPQSVESMNELTQLAAVHLQLISPGVSQPCVAPVQDTMLGAYLLSSDPEAFHTRQMMNSLLWTTKKWNDVQHIFKNKDKTKFISGYEAFSSILPKINVNLKNKNHNTKVNIENGIMKSGFLEKGIFKKESEGLVHVTFKDCSPLETRDMMDDCRGIVTSYMYLRGFSVGISDLVTTPNMKEDINTIIGKCKSEVEKKIQDLHKNSFENQTGMTNQEMFEQRVQSILSRSRDDISKTVLKQSSQLQKCRFQDMVKSGSKGSDVNIAQMMGCLGQQDVDGKRVTYGFENRTLPHFSKFDDSPEARGYVGSSFIKGLNPQEFFFHAMAGREGLIDTAVKTASTGYIQRRLMKSMEDLRAEYDGTVRAVNGQIVQFRFGEDGMDSSMIESQKIIFAGKNWKDIFEMYLPPPGVSVSEETMFEFYKYIYCPFNSSDWAEFENIPNLLSKYKPSTELVNELKGSYQHTGFPIINYYRNYVCNGLYNDTVKYPVNVARIILNVKKTIPQFSYADQATGKITREYIINELNSLCLRIQISDLNPLIQIFKVILYSNLLKYEFSSQDGKSDSLLGKNQLREIVKRVEKEFKKSLVHPGEMVGVIAAQSIGEPATQMTLNTFHLAGVGSKSKVTRGVPRLQELLTLTKNPKSPQLHLYLEDCFKSNKDVLNVKNILEITTLRDITTSTSIYYDPTIDNINSMMDEDRQMLHFINTYQQMIDSNDENSSNSRDNWVVRLELNNRIMLDKNILMEDIYMAMYSVYGNDLDIIYTDDNSDNLSIRIKVTQNDSSSKNQMDDYYLLKMLENNLLDSVVLRGVPLLKNIDLEEEQFNSEYNEKGEHTYNKKWKLVSEGSKDGTNLLEALIHPVVDATRTYSDHITEMHEVLGIEAARASIIEEFRGVIAGSGEDNPPMRHIILLADLMTAQGSYLVSIDRNGVKRSDLGPLAKCSFEETDKQLYQAAVFGEVDKMVGVSANIMLGQVAPCGTGIVDLVFDEKKYFEIRSQPWWEEHQRKWNETNSAMNEMVQTVVDFNPENPFDDDEFEDNVCDQGVEFNYTEDMLND